MHEPTTPPTPRLGRARRAVAITSAVVGATVTFALAAVAGVVVHLDNPAVRRVAASQINRALGSSFQGSVHIGRIEHLGLDGVRGVDVEVRDPEGRRVLLLEDVRARLPAIAVGRSAVLGKGPIEIPISDLHVAYLEAALLQDADGNLSIARTFQPKTPSPSPPSKPGDRGVALHIPGAEVARAWVHGNAGLPLLDADLDALRANVAVVPGSTTLEVVRLAVTGRSFPNGANPVGNVTAKLVLPDDPAADMDVRATYDGRVGDAPLTLSGSMTGKAFQATVDVPRTDSAIVRSLAPGAPLYQPVDAHVEAHGTLPDVTAKVHVGVGAGTVDVDASARLEAAIHGAAKVTVRDVDPRAFEPTAPAASITATVDAAGDRSATGAISGTAKLTTQRTTVSGQVVPGADVHATFTDTTIVGGGVVHEVGAPTSLTFDLHPRPGKPSERVVVFETTTDVPSLMGIARVGPIAKGAAHVHTKGQLALAGPTLDVAVDATLTRVAKADIALEKGFVTATVRGPLDKLVVDASVHGNGLRAKSYFFAQASVTARGPITSPSVTAALLGDDDTPDVTVRAAISTQNGVGVRGGEVTVKRGDTTMVAHLDSLRAGGGVVDVRGLVVDGLGKPILADARLAPGALTLRARAEDVDMMRIAELFEVGKTSDGSALQGHVALDVDVTYAKKDAQGHVTASARDLVIQGVKGAEGDLSVTVDGRDVRTTVGARFGDAGHLDLTSSVLLAGVFLDPASWQKATGGVKIDGDVDLAKLVKELPPAVLPVDKASGRVVVAGTITRADAKQLPDVDLTMRTERLDVIGRSPEPSQTKTLTVHHGDKDAPDQARELAATTQKPAGEHMAAARNDSPAAPAPAETAPGGTKPPQEAAPGPRPDEQVVVAQPTVTPWHTKDLDGSITIKVDAAHDHQGIVASLYDANGNVIEVKLDADAPLAKLLDHPENARTVLATAPLVVHVGVPRRELKHFPQIVKPSGIRGSVELAADFRGSLAAPDLDVHAVATGIEPIGTSTALPFDGDARVRYDGKRADARIKMLRPEGVVLDSDTTVDVALADILSGRPPAWRASSETKLASFPLHSVAAVLDESIEGCVSGVLRVKDLHRDGNASVDLVLANVHLGEAVFPRGTIKADLSSGHLVADARLEQADGFLETHAKGAMTWGAQVAPALDPNAPVDLDVKANGFRLAAALPFVQSQVGELDGRLDADLRVHAIGGDPTKSHVEGFVAVDKGRFEATALGEEFHDVHARVTLGKDGHVTLADLKMKGVTGEIDGSATAQIDGLQLRTADGALHIPQKQKLPITVQGVSYGQAWGDVKVHAETKREGKDMEVAIDIPSFHTDLPESATHSVQDLDDEATIRIGAFRPGPDDQKRFVLLQMHADDANPKTSAVAATSADKDAPGKTRIAVKLGNDVRLTRGTQLDVYVAGNPTIELAGAAPRMTGKVSLQRGRLEVMGKRFKIENGTVSFNPEDASNPEIVATAEWDSPDGTKVYADYVGLVKSGKLTLRSEPSHTQDEIISLVLFGSADGSLGASPPGGDQGGAGKAAGLGGGVATQGINKALSNLTDIDVQTRVDTTDSQNPRPELAIQLSRRVMAEVAYNLGLPAPGQNPDKALLILGYRFRAHWTLETTFGDAGSSLADVIWQYRY